MCKPVFTWNLTGVTATIVTALPFAVAVCITVTLWAYITRSAFVWRWTLPRLSYNKYTHLR